MIRTGSKILVLNTIKNYDLPVGSSYLCHEIDLSQAMIGRIMAECETDGYLKKISNKGRILTKKGLEFIENTELRETKLRTADQLINIVEEADIKQLLEILEVRKLLEVKSARDACLNDDPNVIKDLTNKLIEYIYVFNSGRLGSNEDVQLHLAIARASSNTTLLHIMKIILATDKSHLYAKFSNIMETDQIQIHTTIVDAIRQKNPDKAETAMLNHLNHLSEIIRASENER